MFPWTIRDSDVVAPSRMVAQGDATRFGISSMSDSGRFLVRFVSSAPNWTFGRGTISGRRSGKAVVLFADGHVASEKWRQLHYSSWENWTQFNLRQSKRLTRFRDAGRRNLATANTVRRDARFLILTELRILKRRPKMSEPDMTNRELKI